SRSAHPGGAPSAPPPSGNGCGARRAAGGPARSASPAVGPPCLGCAHVTPARDPHRPAREAVVGAGADAPVRQVDRLLLVRDASADLSRAGPAGGRGLHPGPAGAAAGPRAEEVLRGPARGTRGTGPLDRRVPGP